MIFKPSKITLVNKSEYVHDADFNATLQTD